jgi:DNA-binding NarL/FixJ family response regulator
MDRESSTNGSVGRGSGTKHKSRVLIVDDHPVVREGLTEQINNAGDLEVCGQADSASQALQALHQSRPDLIVLDLGLAEGHGLDVLRHMRAGASKVPVLVFSMFEESRWALASVQAGAKGYVGKHEPPGRLLEAIRTILRGEYALSPEATSQLLRATRRGALGPGGGAGGQLGGRERQVFELIGKGNGTREIAAALGCSVKTIETYRARIKRKLQINDAPTLVREAVRWVESTSGVGAGGPTALSSPRQLMRAPAVTG